MRIPIDPIVLLDRMLRAGLRVEVWQPGPREHAIVKVVGKGQWKGALVEALREAYRVCLEVKPRAFDDGRMIDA